MNVISHISVLASWSPDPNKGNIDNSTIQFDHEGSLFVSAGIDTEEDYRLPDGIIGLLKILPDGTQSQLQLFDDAAGPGNSLTILPNGNVVFGWASKLETGPLTNDGSGGVLPSKVAGYSYALYDSDGGLIGTPYYNTQTGLQEIIARDDGGYVIVEDGDVSLSTLYYGDPARDRDPDILIFDSEGNLTGSVPLPHSRLDYNAQAAYNEEALGLIWYHEITPGVAVTHFRVEFSTLDLDTLEMSSPFRLDPDGTSLMLSGTSPINFLSFSSSVLGLGNGTFAALTGEQYGPDVYLHFFTNEGAPLAQDIVLEYENNYRFGTAVWADGRLAVLGDDADSNRLEFDLIATDGTIASQTIDMDLETGEVWRELSLSSLDDGGALVVGISHSSERSVARVSTAEQK